MIVDVYFRVRKIKREASAGEPSMQSITAVSQDPELVEYTHSPDTSFDSTLSLHIHYFWQEKERTPSVSLLINARKGRQQSTL